jgi:hypothetical protein
MVYIKLSTTAYSSIAGFLLSQTVAFWRARAGDGAGGGAAPPTADRREASFNTSFTLRGAAPVAFTVLLDRFPPFNAAIGLGLRGNADANGPVAAAAANASSTLAAVEVGAVRSYGPDAPNVGLNVTVTPGGAAPMRRAVWIEYDAAAHRLSVSVADAGEARPPGALLDVPVNLVERGTTQTALVGFFAAAVSDIWSASVDGN